MWKQPGGGGRGVEPRVSCGAERPLCQVTTGVVCVCVLYYGMGDFVAKAERDKGATWVCRAGCSFVGHCSGYSSSDSLFADDTACEQSIGWRHYILLDTLPCDWPNSPVSVSALLHAHMVVPQQLSVLCLQGSQLAEVWLQLHLHLHLHPGPSMHWRWLLPWRRQLHLQANASLRKHGAVVDGAPLIHMQHDY